MVRTGRISRCRTNASILLPDQILIGQLLVPAVTPFLSDSLVKKLREGLGRMLERSGASFVLRAPVHREVYRLLVERSLYRGMERRRHARVALGAAIKLRVGRRTHAATLCQLSRRGCGLQVDAEIGRGAMGVVYRAWQSAMERSVAVKVLHRSMVRDPAIRVRFAREARSVARLSHPNIVTVHVVGETDQGQPFMVMEMVEGQRLDELAEQQG